MRNMLLLLITMTISADVLAESWGDLMFLQKEGDVVAETGFKEGMGTSEYDQGTLVSGHYNKVYNSKIKNAQRAALFSGTFGLSKTSRIGVKFNYLFKGASSTNSQTNSATGGASAGNGATTYNRGFSDVTFNYQKRFMKELTDGYNWDFLVTAAPGIGRAYRSGQSAGNGYDAIEGNNRHGGHVVSLGTQASKILLGIESILYLNMIRNFETKETLKVSPFERNWLTHTTKPHNVWDIGAKFQYKFINSFALNTGISYMMSPVRSAEYCEVNNGANRTGKETTKKSKTNDLTLNVGIREIYSSTMFFDFSYLYNMYDNTTEDFTAQGAPDTYYRKNTNKWTNHSIILNVNFLF